MKKTTLFTAFLLCFIGQNKSQNRTTIFEKKNSISKIQSSNSYFILQFSSKKKDTLFVNCNNQECSLLYKKDTLTKFWSFENASKAIKSINNGGVKNTFLIQSYQGDGCPTTYQLIAFKNDSFYFLSKLFGNCNEIASIKNNKNNLELAFDGEKEMNRKKTTYLFNKNNFTLLQKK